jgi:ABC-2 type transport system ATP-binding protein
MDDSVVIKVEHLSKTFKLPHEKVSSLKGMLVGFTRRNKGYEIQHVLEDISFEIHKGDFFGVVGRNGSGKSTLLKLLAGIYYPTKGAIHVSGKLTPFIELGVGFNPELTGRENVFLNGALLGFSRKEMLAMYQSIVDFAEIERFMDQKLKNYSSGMQVRLAFSIAIRAKSDILLIDEVLAVGDAAFQQKCFDYFEKLKKEKRTIVLVTHDMSVVKRFCNRAILIDEGNLKLAGSPEEVANQYLFENLNTGETATEIVNEQLKPMVSSLEVMAISPVKRKNTEEFIFEVAYKLNKPLPVYLGFSVMYQGISMIEHNSRSVRLKYIPDTKHVVRYTLPLAIFNTGSFKINVTIFSEDTLEVLGYVVDSCDFFITSSDQTKAGPIATTGFWLPK